MPQNSITVDSSVFGWLMTAGGTFLMFLLGLGIKDLKDRLHKSEELCREFARYRAEVEERRGEIRRQLAELNGEIQRLEQRIEDLREEKS